ncbi:Formyltransferase [Punctularia strigosozonata HHB-11173 SS5]|uniref:Formyltransferase n=1 Tax=Punctularia strigosozonata (strain HHB-11173) TaxID=741275 RepID=UPI00044183CD|nr:Formyltransferase [Punctularia strigosozonata HHB-11173 SS5]EIN08600.1 Formyltransferase [Punctularia strigosozonata HHB-11173 SS5]
MVGNGWTSGPVLRTRARTLHVPVPAAAAVATESPTQGGKPFDILFFGRDEFSCTVFEELHRATDVWSSVKIATQPDAKVGRRGSQLSVSPLKTLAASLGVAVHEIPRAKRDFRTWQLPEPFRPSPPPPATHLLVTASFGRILSRAHLSAFAPGRRLNVHPSLLPAYRGPAPIQRALLDGARTAGACAIEMTERRDGIDAGDVWGHRRVTLPDGHFAHARDLLAREGGALLVSVLRDMLADRATAVPQSSLIPRAPAITAADAAVDFRTMSASDIVRIHDAISHQKPLTTHIHIADSHPRTLQLHDPATLPLFPSPTHQDRLPPTAPPPPPGTALYAPHDRRLAIACARGTVLGVSALKPQDRALVSAKDWWNGLRPDVPRGVDGSVLLGS